MSRGGRAKITAVRRDATRVWTRIRVLDLVKESRSAIESIPFNDPDVAANLPGVIDLIVDTLSSLTDAIEELVLPPPVGVAGAGGPRPAGPFDLPVCGRCGEVGHLASPPESPDAGAACRAWLEAKIARYQQEGSR